MAANRDLSLTQLDVKTAFLYGDVTEELYARPPEGFITPGKEKWVCRLHKGLYGLKQSSRLWNIKFDASPSMGSPVQQTHYLCGAGSAL